MDFKFAMYRNKEEKESVEKENIEKERMEKEKANQPSSVLSNMKSIDSGFEEISFDNENKKEKEKEKTCNTTMDKGKKVTRANKKSFSYSEFSFDSVVNKYQAGRFHSSLLNQEFHGFTLQTILEKTAEMSSLKTKQLENIDLEKKLQKVKTRKNIEKWRMHSRKLQKELEQRKMNGEEINFNENPPFGIDPDWNIETGPKLTPPPPPTLFSKQNPLPLFLIKVILL